MFNILVYWYGAVNVLNHRISIVLSLMQVGFGQRLLVPRHFVVSQTTNLFKMQTREAFKMSFHIGKQNSIFGSFNQWRSVGSSGTNTEKHLVQQLHKLRQNDYIVFAPVQHNQVLQNSFTNQCNFLLPKLFIFRCNYTHQLIFIFNHIWASVLPSKITFSLIIFKSRIELKFALIGTLLLLLFVPSIFKQADMVG